MNDINVDELYEIYRRNNNGLLSKFTFNRLMKNYKTSECIEGLRSIFLGKYNNNDFPFDEQKLYVGFFNLLNKYSLSDITNMIRNYYGENDDTLKTELFSMIGLKYPFETKHLTPAFALNFICNDFVGFDYLLSVYGETIFNAMLEVDQYYKYISVTLKNNDIDTYDKFLEYSKSNKEDNQIQSAFNSLLYNISMKYTVAELLQESDKIKKEIATGITFYLPDLASNKDNEISKNREIFDKMADHFDSRTLAIIINSESYLKPIENLINSNRMNEENLLFLRDIYTMFYQIYNYAKTDNFQGILDLIEETVKNDENGFDFCDIINDQVLTYETLIREDIVENINSFENVPNTRVSFTDSKGLTTSLDCAIVTSCSQLSSTLVHMFNNEKQSQEDIAFNYMVNVINTVGEHTITNHSREAQDIKNVIVQLYKVFSEYNNRYINPERNAMAEIHEKLSKIITPEEIKMCDEKFKLYQEHYHNFAEVTQINTNSDTLLNFLSEATNNFKEPLSEEVSDFADMNRKLRIITSPINESVLATQILRLNNSQDFTNLVGIYGDVPYRMAVSFDKRGLSEESIMISSTDNIESNNMPITNFFEQYPINRRSASLDMLKNTVGESGMTRRTNSEIDLIRSSVTPQNLVLFFNTPMTDKVIEGIKEAQELANKSNLRLVLVDYQAIRNELRNQENKEQSKVITQEEEMNISRSR